LHHFFSLTIYSSFGQITLSFGVGDEDALLVALAPAAGVDVGGWIVDGICERIFSF